MFNKLFAARINALIAADEDQHTLDTLRMSYAANQEMQLHFDRMQTAFDNTLAIELPKL